jgi:DNA mismatch repair protein MutS2
MNLNLIGKQNKHELLVELDWHDIISKLIGGLHFEGNKERLANPPHYRDIGQIKTEFDLTEEFIENQLIYNQLCAPHLSHINATIDNETRLKLLKKGAIGDIPLLNYCCNLIELYSTLAPELKGKIFHKRFAFIDESLRVFNKSFVNPFREYVSPKGEQSFHKHPELSKLYHSLHELESSIRKKLQHITQSDFYSKALQNKEHDIIRDCYVISIRSDSYQAKLGRILSKSSTGMTLFVEPSEIKGLNQQRADIISQIDLFIHKIIHGHCVFLTENFNELNGIQRCLISFDEFLAKARFSKSQSLTRPEISNEPIVKFDQLFHPLIESPVKNDLAISSDVNGFVISGPNTGGKTILLKSIAVSYLLLYSGLFVPAAHAQMGIFEQLYFIGNDSQDINLGLSSFASEVTKYSFLMDSLSGAPEQRALIIIDEIFNTTNSEEGSALGSALLKTLTKHYNCKLAISTHHDYLKNVLYQAKNYVSGHMIYDQENLRPTYQLQIGQPGHSHALDIFSTLLKDSPQIGELLDYAKSTLNHKRVSYESLLQELSAEKAKLNKLLIDNQTLNQQLANQKAANKAALKLEKETMVKKFKQDLQALQNKAVNIVGQAKKGQINTVRAVNKQFDKLDHSVSALSPKDKFHHKKPAVQTRPSLTLDEIAVDQTVYHLSLDKNFKVIQINKRKKSAQIKSDGVALWAPIETLAATKGSVKSSSQKKSKVATSHTYKPQNLESSVDFDARGMRLEEFQSRVDRFIYSLINQDIPFLNIIHGHGEGILKSWLRKHLRTFPELNWKVEDGNDGCTQVELKK